MFALILLSFPYASAWAQSPSLLPQEKSLAPTVSFAAEDACKEPTSTRVPLNVFWDYGVRFESDNQKFNLHIGGIGHVDSVFFYGSPDLYTAPGGAANGVGDAQASFLRRAILLAEGRIYGRYDFMLQYDFANASNDSDGQQPPSFGDLAGNPAALNIWMQVRDVPFLGRVRIGNQTKTVGLENNTSANDLNFMERADVMDAFYGAFDNGFSLGVTAQHWNESERITWRYGIFQPSTDVFGVALNHYTLGARITALPWYEGQGERLVHVGLGYWGGELVQGQFRSRVRPLLRNGPGFAVPVLADTDQVPGSRQYAIAPELAMVFGPFTLQAEYGAQFLTEAVASNGQNQGTVMYQSGYLEALCFLTGEHQPYDRQEGAFGRVVPKHNYIADEDGCRNGLGAWQVGIRYSFVDLNDKAIQGGQLYSWTFGLNWYLNPNMKVQFNYLTENRDTPGVPVGWIQGLGLRAAFNF